VRPEDITTFDDLDLLPTLTREEIQRCYPDIISRAVPQRQQVAASTSGSTGTGLRFVTTQAAVHSTWATWWRYRRWHGIELGTWCGHFGGRAVVPVSQAVPPFWRYNYPGRQILFSVYHMAPATLDAYVAELRRRRPPWLHGYPSALALLAAHMLDRRLELGYDVRWITTGAENLMPQQVTLLQRAFGVRPRQHYGMAESVANISECELGSLHVDEDYAAVEFIPNPDGPGHRIIGTSLTNLATPFLRYDVQDVAVLSNDGCPCGRPGRVVASLDGRAEDYVILKNGARLGRMYHVVAGLMNIREAQVYQRVPGEVVIRVVRGAGYGESDEAQLLDRVRHRVAGLAEVRVDYVDAVQRSRTGKLRFVVSDVPEGQLEYLC